MQFCSLHCSSIQGLAKSSIVHSVLAEANVFDLCWTNQINNICNEAIHAGDIPASIVARNVGETCMNLTCIHLKSALAQSPFIAFHSLPMTATKSTMGSAQMPESKSLMQFFRTVIMDTGNVC